ncbi:MAG TPA: dihydrofolate reductase family protein [Actinomycetota bacterium]
MADVVAFESVTLDGVMKAPGRPDEDTRDGFAHGGWAAPYADHVTMGLAGEGSSSTGAMLFGRRTYEDFAGFWPNQPDNPFTDVLTATRKYVASTTLAEPLPWANSTLLSGDVPAAVERLEADLDGDLLILGSGVFVRWLIARGLVDRLIMLIHPLVLGSGRRLFEEGLPATRFGLTETRTSATGVVIATYERG